MWGAGLMKIMKPFFQASNVKLHVYDRRKNKKAYFHVIISYSETLVFRGKSIRGQPVPLSFHEAGANRN